MFSLSSGVAWGVATKPWPPQTEIVGGHILIWPPPKKASQSNFLVKCQKLPKIVEDVKKCIPYEKKITKKNIVFRNIIDEFLFDHQFLSENAHMSELKKTLPFGFICTHGSYADRFLINLVGFLVESQHIASKTIEVCFPPPTKFRLEILIGGQISNGKFQVAKYPDKTFIHTSLI